MRHDAKNLVLGIESSCDDTGMAVFNRSTNTILASLLKSQLEAHIPFGGVVPEIAARKHLDALTPLFDATMDKAGVSTKELSAVAVTEGPGLMGPLLVGTCFAHGLANALNVPLIGVNHIHAHLWGAFLDLEEFESSDRLRTLFPCFGMVVSGGHCNLYYMQTPEDFSLIGWTRDDAPGECFDKVGKMLGLSYPGGPKIEKLARDASHKHDFDLGQTKIPGLEFSFSGLKTQVGRVIQKKNFSKDNPQQVADLCNLFQNRGFAQITNKLTKAKEEYPNIKSIVIAGGVSANLKFRELCAHAIPGVRWIFPGLKYCTDNGAMIAALGSRSLDKANNRAQKNTTSLTPYPRYPFAEYMTKNKSV